MADGETKIERREAVRDGEARVDAAAFWQQQYRGRLPSPDIHPHSALVELIAARPPGRGLELGCGHGDHALWCATQGWEITAVDISAIALERLMARADDAGVAERVHAERHDLMHTLPSGPFDLVFAMFMHSPAHAGFVREHVLRRAADTVSSGGLLLDVTHGSRLPWSWPDPNATPFPSPSETLRVLDLDAAVWRPQRLDTVWRKVTGPDGQTAVATDTVVCVRRL